ncbi:GSCOCG00009247001-RA-CDS, partial [Cotesia congregata]
LFKTLAPSTIWSRWSMLRTMISINQSIEIRNYSRLKTLIKNNAKSHRQKKSKVFSWNEIKKFIDEAPDNALRPNNSNTDRFFLHFQKCRCVRQVIGKNIFGQVPKKIATYLNLLEPEKYTGHSFRRTSTTLLADSRASMTTIKQHGGWRSDTKAYGYIENSIRNKKKIYDQI